MPRQNLTNEEVANVMTYVLNSFGNDGGEVTPEQVQRIKERAPMGTN
jgi:nitrite reductase (NO-forming)